MTFTSPVAAIQLAAGVFLVKLPPMDLISLVAASQLAAGFFFGENDNPGFDKPCCCYPASRRRLFGHPRSRRLGKAPHPLPLLTEVSQSAIKKTLTGWLTS